MMINDKINFPHKLLLTNRQVANFFCQVFANNSLTDIKLSKTQLSKMMDLLVDFLVHY